LFAFDLALALGWPDVDAMLEAMPLPIFYEWNVYARARPFGEERADLRAGIVASTIANANRGKSGRSFRPADFMPKFHRQARRQSPKEIAMILEAGYQQASRKRKRG
jgi:hypothetical protein